MMRINRKLDNEFWHNYADNESKNKDNNKIQKIDNRTSEKSSSYTLEYTRSCIIRINIFMTIVFYLKCFQMLSYDGLSQKPLLFKSFTGLSVRAFDDIYTIKR